MAAQGWFRGEVISPERGSNGAYIDFKLGQERYQQPVLCSVKSENMPADVKAGDLVVIEGRVMAKKSKAGNAYQTLYALSVSRDLDATNVASEKAAASK